MSQSATTNLRWDRTRALQVAMPLLAAATGGAAASNDQASTALGDVLPWSEPPVAAFVDHTAPRSLEEAEVLARCADGTLDAPTLYSLLTADALDLLTDVVGAAESHPLVRSVRLSWSEDAEEDWEAIIVSVLRHDVSDETWKALESALLRPRYRLLARIREPGIVVRIV